MTSKFVNADGCIEVNGTAMTKDESIETATEILRVHSEGLAVLNREAEALKLGDLALWVNDTEVTAAPLGVRCEMCGSAQDAPCVHIHDVQHFHFHKVRAVKAKALCHS